MINEIVIAADIDWSFLWPYVTFGIAMAAVVEAMWLRLK